MSLLLQWNILQVRLPMSASMHEKQKTWSFTQMMASCAGSVEFRVQFRLHNTHCRHLNKLQHRSNWARSGHSLRFVLTSAVRNSFDVLGQLQNRRRTLLRLLLRLNQMLRQKFHNCISLLSIRRMMLCKQLIKRGWSIRIQYPSAELERKCLTMAKRAPRPDEI